MTAEEIIQSHIEQLANAASAKHDEAKELRRQAETLEADAATMMLDVDGLNAALEKLTTPAPKPAAKAKAKTAK